MLSAPIHMWENRSILCRLFAHLSTREITHVELIWGCKSSLIHGTEKLSQHILGLGLVCANKWMLAHSSCRLWHKEDDGRERESEKVAKLSLKPSFTSVCARDVWASRVRSWQRVTRDRAWDSEKMRLIASVVVVVIQFDFHPFHPPSPSPYILCALTTCRCYQAKEASRKEFKKEKRKPEWMDGTECMYMLEVKGCKNRINLNQLIHICHLVPSCCFLFVMNVMGGREREAEASTHISSEMRNEFLVHNFHCCCCVSCERSHASDSSSRSGVEYRISG